MRRTIDCMRSRPHEQTDLAYWVHTPTGYVWAVEVEADGDIVSAAGPLLATEAAPEVISHLIFDTRDVAWIKHNWQHFMRASSSESCRVSPACRLHA
jgi:hypothetical protein